MSVHSKVLRYVGAQHGISVSLCTARVFWYIGAQQNLDLIMYLKLFLLIEVRYCALRCGSNLIFSDVWGNFTNELFGFLLIFLMLLNINVKIQVCWMHEIVQPMISHFGKHLYLCNSNHIKNKCFWLGDRLNCIHLKCFEKV